jgi:hypothetical protein
MVSVSEVCIYVYVIVVTFGMVIANLKMAGWVMGMTASLEWGRGLCSRDVLPLITTPKGLRGCFSRCISILISPLSTGNPAAQENIQYLRLYSFKPIVYIFILKDILFFKTMFTESYYSIGKIRAHFVLSIIPYERIKIIAALHSC